MFFSFPRPNSTILLSYEMAEILISSRSCGKVGLISSKRHWFSNLTPPRSIYIMKNFETAIVVIDAAPITTKLPPTATFPTNTMVKLRLARYITYGFFSCLFSPLILEGKVNITPGRAASLDAKVSLARSSSKGLVVISVVQFLCHFCLIHIAINYKVI